MSCCPMCGSVLSRREPIDPPLPPLQREILRTLMQSEGRWVSCPKLTAEVYRDDPNGGPKWAEANVRVGIHKLRKSLRPLGFTVENRKWTGYRLVEARR